MLTAIYRLAYISDDGDDERVVSQFYPTKEEASQQLLDLIEEVSDYYSDLGEGVPFDSQIVIQKICLNDLPDVEELCTSIPVVEFVPDEPDSIWGSWVKKKKENK